MTATARLLLAICAAFALVSLCPAQTNTSRSTYPKDSTTVTTETIHAVFSTLLTDAIRELEEAHGVRIGLSLRDRYLPLQFDYRGDELFHAASTMKVPVMIEVFRQSEQGAFSMNDTRIVTAECRSMLDGSPFIVDAREYLESRIGQPETIHRITAEMIQVSDNLATNMLIEMCGAQKITAGMRRLGAKNGYVIRQLQDNEAYEAGISNRLTPNDLTILMEAVDRNTAASPESCEQMRQILLGQKFVELIPGNLPPEAKVANKTGNITGINHDTAIVYAPFGTWYLTILTDGFRNRSEANKAISGLSRMIWDERAKY